MEYILGVVVSVVVEVMKKYGKLSSIGTMICLLALSIVVGQAWVLLQTSGHWEQIVQVLGYAAAFHNLVLRRFDK